MVRSSSAEACNSSSVWGSIHILSIKNDAFGVDIVMNAVDGTPEALMPHLVSDDQISGQAQIGKNMPQCPGRLGGTGAKDHSEVEVAVFASSAFGARTKGHDFHRVRSGDQALEGSPDLFLGHSPGNVSGLRRGGGHGGFRGQYSITAHPFERSRKASYYRSRRVCPVTRLCGPER